MPDRVKPAELKRFLAQSPRAAGRRSLTQFHDRWRQRQAAADADADAESESQRMRNQRTTQRRRPK